MDQVTMRELRNQGGHVVDRVQHGESVTVTRSGRPVARLVPVGDSALTATALLERWRHLPAIDPVGLREDLDAVIDSRL